MIRSLWNHIIVSSLETSRIRAGVSERQFIVCENVAGVSDKTHTQTQAALCTTRSVSSVAVWQCSVKWQCTEHCWNGRGSSQLYFFGHVSPLFTHNSSLRRGRRQPNSPAAPSQISNEMVKVKAFLHTRAIFVYSRPAHPEQCLSCGAATQGLVTHGAHTPHLQPLHHTPAKTCTSKYLAPLTKWAKM